jgi:hypothetical protein
MSPNQNSRVHALLRLAVSGLLLWGGAAVAGSALVTGFEAPAYNGSAAGVAVTGQQGWYVPNVAGSVDQFVFTYDGNALGIPANPFGEAQFLGAQTLNLGDFPRAQLDFDWTRASIWAVAYDITHGFNGTLPAFNNLSSFSLQDSTVARYFIALNTWSNPDTADHWDANYAVFTSDGTMVDLPGLSPGPAWRNLAVNHWYRQTVFFCFDTNDILTVVITDLETGNSSAVNPEGWYLAGGAVSRPPLPTALRFFVGGGDASDGNVGAWDNLEIDAISGPSIPNGNVLQGAQPIQVKGGPVTN